MDTVAIELSRPDTATLAQLVDQVLDGQDAVVVYEGGGASFLRDAALRLEDRRCRVVPVSAATGATFTLSALLAQVTGQPDLDVQDDETLERGFHLLTVPGPGCDRIVLTIDGADCLQDTVFRYLQFACKAAPELQLVLAGRTDATARVGEGAAFLRDRLAQRPAFRVGTPATKQPERPQPAAIPAVTVTDGASGTLRASERAPGPASRKRRAGWMVAGVGMAASAVFGFGLGWQARSGSRTSTAPPAASTRTEPANLSRPAGTVAAPPAPDPASHAVIGPPVQTTAPGMAAPAGEPAAVPAGHGADPLPTEAPAEPRAADPAPAMSLPAPPLPGTAAAPGPDVQPSPAVPNQVPAPAADDVPSVATPPVVPARPMAPAAPPQVPNTAPDRARPAASAPPRSRNADPGATRDHRHPNTEEHRPGHQSEPPAGRSGQVFQPQDAALPASRPAIGYFTVGPDGVRVFHPNP